MKNVKIRMFFIKIAYWLGIGADALWAAGLFFPRIFGILISRPDFDPDMQTKLIMGIAGTLMTGWTILLIWALNNPIQRRFVILLTAFPVVFGMLVVSIIGFLEGNTSDIWIIIKLIVLITSMITSYILSRKVENQTEVE